MKKNPVAKRYAKAIFEIALESKEVDTVHRELEDIFEILNQGRIHAFLMAPEISKPKKINFVNELFSGKISIPVFNFLKLLIMKSRLELFSQILIDFRRLVDEQKNRLHATVTSAVALQDADLKNITEMISNATQKEIILKNKIDQSIIGGLIIDVASTRLDSSMKQKIRNMQESLIAIEF